MNLIIFDDSSRTGLLPFTHTRPVADIRWGIFTNRERWENLSGLATSTLVPSWLSEVFPIKTESENWLLNGSVFPDQKIYNAVVSLEMNTRLTAGEVVVAARLDGRIGGLEDLLLLFEGLPEVKLEEPVLRIENSWDIFTRNDRAIRTDFDWIKTNRKSQPIPDHVPCIDKENIFLEEGAVISFCTINATTGPIYIGKKAEVMEGCLLRGPLSVGDGAVLKMGAKIYGATTIGPGCRAGGELSNVVMFANSNKGHDGFLGNSVIGEWCNLGADTNCSNLKNNYDEVKIWDENQMRSVKTGLQFFGLMMGDHSKCGINTMFNTGTVAGVSCNIFGAGFPEKFIPSFSWGGSEGLTSYDFNRAMETAERMMLRRNRTLTESERKMYLHIFEQTTDQRKIFCK